MEKRLSFFKLNHSPHYYYYKVKFYNLIAFFWYFSENPVLRSTHLIISTNTIILNAAPTTIAKPYAHGNVKSKKSLFFNINKTLYNNAPKCIDATIISYLLI